MKYVFMIEKKSKNATAAKYASYIMPKKTLAFKWKQFLRYYSKMEAMGWDCVQLSSSAFEYRCTFSLEGFSYTQNAGAYTPG